MANQHCEMMDCLNNFHIVFTKRCEEYENSILELSTCNPEPVLPYACLLLQVFASLQLYRVYK